MAIVTVHLIYKETSPDLFIVCFCRIFKKRMDNLIQAMRRQAVFLLCRHNWLKCGEDLS